MTPSSARKRKRSREDPLDIDKYADASERPGFLEFPFGRIATTRNKYYPHDANSMSLADIISNRTFVRSAVVLTYGYEEEWLLKHFDRETEVLIVSQANQKKYLEGQAYQIVQDRPNTLRYCPPFQHCAGNKGCMHIKMLLLTHADGHIRLCIPSANFMSFEWEVIEDVLYAIDLPPLPAPKFRSQSGFHRQLQDMFAMLHIPKHYWGHLDQIDYSIADASSRIVISREGIFEAPTLTAAQLAKADDLSDFHKYGMNGLRQALFDLKCVPRSHEEFHLTFQSSSVCMYSSKWLNTFYDRLDCSSNAFSLRTAVKKTQSANPLPPIKLLYPTAERVDRSLEGNRKACSRMTSEIWRASNAPEISYDTESKRPGLVSHSKILVGVLKGHRMADEGDTRVRGFLYLGSHNFTKAAFGRILPANNNKRARLRIINHEMGIVLPITAASQKEAEAIISQIVPWERPQKYKKSQRPFIMTKQHIRDRQKQDIFQD